MRDHIKLLGILNIILGSLGLLAAVVIFAGMSGIAGIVSMAGDRDALPAAGIMGAIGVIVGLGLALLSLPQVLGGWGLLKYQGWARVLMIIVSIFSLLHFPFGTALGVYGIWVLFSDETRYLFATGGRGTTPPTYPPAGYPSSANYPPPAPPVS